MSNYNFGYFDKSDALKTSNNSIGASIYDQNFNYNKDENVLLKRQPKELITQKLGCQKHNLNELKQSRSLANSKALSLENTLKSKKLLFRRSKSFNLAEKNNYNEKLCQNKTKFDFFASTSKAENSYINDHKMFYNSSSGNIFPWSQKKQKYCKPIDDNIEYSKNNLFLIHQNKKEDIILPFHLRILKSIYLRDHNSTTSSITSSKNMPLIMPFLNYKVSII